MKSSTTHHLQRKVQAVSVPKNGLTFRSLFLHAWDLSEGGVENVMGWMRDAGLNTLCLAGTYHSGWFLHPQARQHRSYLTEGSAFYFHPQKSLYKNIKLQPQVAKLCAKKDWFAEAGRRVDRYGLRLVSWTIGTHNTRLGLAHPELTQQNVYGDRLPHALCPANPDVRRYLKALCRDLATNHPLWGMQLESFGWMSFAHGHHHERDLVGLTPLEQELMGLCVCSACVREATKAAHVEMGRVKEIIKGTLDAAFREAPDRPKNHLQSMAEMESKSKDLKKFNVWRRLFVHELVAEIKSESLRGTECRLLLQSGFDPELADVVDGFACGAYQKTAQETLASCRTGSSVLPRDWPGLMQCFIQLGMGVPKSEQQLREIIRAVRVGGCNGINFYNRSEAPPKMLQWLKNVLPNEIN